MKKIKKIKIKVNGKVNSIIEKTSLFKLANNKPIYPHQSEIKINPPSRSAKLRYGIKIGESSDFNDFISKFESLLKIENLSNEL